MCISKNIVKHFEPFSYIYLSVLNTVFNKNDVTIRTFHKTQHAFPMLYGYHYNIMLKLDYLYTSRARVIETITLPLGHGKYVAKSKRGQASFKIQIKLLHNIVCLFVSLYLYSY